jgi:hypothetical protein
MEMGDSAESIVFMVSIIDIIDGGRFSATIADSSKMTINLPHGTVKIRIGDDYITGRFSGTKREATDARGRYRVWRECSFGEVVMPESSERSIIGIEGVRYEIHITTAKTPDSSDQQDEIHMSRGEMFFRLPHVDVVERRVMHTCTADCMRECPAGAWIRAV